MKVMIVDDEQLVRWFLDRALKKSGFEVISAAGVKEAMSRLQAEDIDILMLDLRMPGGDGTELIDRLDRLGKRPKTIVCSAFITAELEEELRRKNICILRKPFKLDELNDVLNFCL